MEPLASGRKFPLAFLSIFAALMEGRTGRIIPVGKLVNNHGDRKSPKSGCSPSKWLKWLVNGVYEPLTN